MQSICEVDQQSGEVHFVSGKVPMSILIGKGWQSHVKGGKPSGAYLSKGFTKYAFQVRSYAVIFYIQTWNILWIYRGSSILKILLYSSANHAGATLKRLIAMIYATNSGFLGRRNTSLTLFTSV
jgi:hypothetical protein